MYTDVSDTATAAGFDNGAGVIQVANGATFNLQGDRA
jgi:hypothetical protein